jgi:hypothetical protein
MGRGHSNRSEGTRLWPLYIKFALLAQAVIVHINGGWHKHVPLALGRGGEDMLGSEAGNKLLYPIEVRHRDGDSPALLIGRHNPLYVDDPIFHVVIHGINIVGHNGHDISHAPDKVQVFVTHPPPSILCYVARVGPVNER